MPQNIFRRLIDRDGQRTEADIQADVRSLLLLPQLQLDDGDLRIVNLEAQVGDRRRIDVELGSAVIEVKRDLRRGRIRNDAIEQLAGYVAERTRTTGTRYLGILTDGAEWTCYDLVDAELHRVSTIDASHADIDLDRLIVWLEGVLGTAQHIPATSAEIATRLGAGSSSHELDRATIAALYAQNRDLATVRMKRSLWSKLLTSTLGNQFEDTDELFVEHTLLVNSAEIIAHSVLGLDVANIEPEDVLSGHIFNQSSIYGVVEQDFFDWPLEVEGGPEFVRSLTKRLARFDWHAVEQDVLKTLYESVIGTETRKRLGEYYTPDWLAEMVVNEVIDQPLETRALDPACGSGTFLFHAVRQYIAAAREDGQAVGEILSGVSQSIYGMDLHPVAVTLARVTYLLAIGRELLTDPERGPIFIPVYLGDSIQWSGQTTNLWNAGDLVVPVEDNVELFHTELRFPDRLLTDATMFDQLVESMAQAASQREAGDRIPSLGPLFQRLGVPEQNHETITATFRTMCELHDQGRNHIWSYYVRNLARPMWLSRPDNRVDALMGNPPWLAYRHMPDDMQQTFREMEEQRGLWAGAQNATHQDLSALFVVRAVELYLRDAGKFGLVMPNAVVDRDHYAGFRCGSYVSAAHRTQIAFNNSWDFRRVRPHFFPRGSSVIFGERSADEAEMMPLEATGFTGTLPRGMTALVDVRGHLEATQILNTIRIGASSPYSARFRQGAILSPRFCFVVERREAGPLGAAAGSISITSSRSPSEKTPWKELQSLEGMIEERFLHPLYTGASLLPFRTNDPLQVAIPHNGRELIDSDDQIAQYQYLNEWWNQAEEVWESNRSSDKLSLIQQLDYMSKLTNQYPIPPRRVIYNTAGMHVAAAKLFAPQGVVNSDLYWCAVGSENEANYLCAILNSPVTTEFVRPLMSYGKDERHVHKHIWKLSIPDFDANDVNHVRLSELGATVEIAANTVEIDQALHFAASRRKIRNALNDLAETTEINNLVYELIS